MTDEQRDELLVRIDEHVKGIDDKLRSDYRVLHGNGHPGLISRVQTLETNWRWAKWIAALIAGFVTLIVNILTKHW